jgi:hypothetical protein
MKPVHNYGSKRGTTCFGTELCTPHNNDFVSFACPIINDFHIICEHPSICGKLISKINQNLFYYKNQCYLHQRMKKIKQITRDFLPISALIVQGKNLMKNPKIVQAIEDKHFIKLYGMVVGNSTSSIFTEGASEVVELEVLKNVDETFIVGGYFMLELLQHCPELLLNLVGFSHLRSNNVNCKIVAGIFKSRPNVSEENCLITKYKAKFEEIWKIALQDAELIAATYLRLKKIYNSLGFLVTIGCTTDPLKRDKRYADTNLYLSDSELVPLAECPKHFTPEDMIAREAFGILACKSHPILSESISNMYGGADSIKANTKGKILKNYYHISKPGISKIDLNLIKTNLPNMNAWKVKNYENIERVDPKTVEIVGERNETLHPSISLKRIFWSLQFTKNRKFEICVIRELSSFQNCFFFAYSIIKTSNCTRQSRQCFLEKLSLSILQFFEMKYPLI